MDFLHEYIFFNSLCKSVRYFYQYWYVESSELEKVSLQVQDLQKVF